jgi:hypothetical protein
VQRAAWQRMFDGAGDSMRVLSFNSMCNAQVLEKEA